MAWVVAIEFREANIEKARYAKQQLGIEGLELCRDDVRNLSEERRAVWGSEWESRMPKE